MFDVPTWAWIGTIVLIAVLLAVDFFGHVRKPHVPSLPESLTWSAIYVSVAVIFGVGVWLVLGPDFGQEFFAGYVTEKALSIDNLFVFVLIMASFRVPREYQQKVLLIGIVLALVLRTAFIFAGAALVERFSFIFYVFGIFLIWTAIAQVRKSTGQEEFGDNALLRFTRRVLPTTETYVGDRLTHRVQGRLHITPMLIVMVAVGSADVLFAVDSIPAIFGLTQHVFLIFAANAFSLLGLRQLYFLLDGLLDRLVYLKYGLAAILALIGAKLVIHAMHSNTFAFLNEGREITLIPEIPTTASLLAILGILVLTTVLSVTVGKRGRAPSGS